MLCELPSLGFRFEFVLTDSLYGESHSNFISVLELLKLPYIVAIRPNHGVWLPQEHEVYQDYGKPLSEPSAMAKLKSAIAVRSFIENVERFAIGY
jgi:SRSO17 transposase